VQSITGKAALFLALALALPAEGDEVVGNYLRRIKVPDGLVATAETPVVVAIVDDGVRGSHEWIRDFIWTNVGEVPNNGRDDDGNGLVDDVHGWDWADNDADTEPPRGRDGYHHGTHLAGIIATVARKALGGEAARHVRIMPVKVLADGANSPILTGVYDGIAYAVDQGADVVLTAWGQAIIAQDEERVLEKAVANDVLLIAAAGNFPDERPQYPAAHPAAVGVSGIGADGRLSKTSNFGAFVDLAAPAEGIVSAGTASDSATMALDGTSFAAGMVAAAGALVKLRHPEASAEEVRGCLVSSARVLRGERHRFFARAGSGVLDVAEAIACSAVMEGETGEISRDAAKGYLRPSSMPGAEVVWRVEPEGEVKGLRFSLVEPAGEGAVGQLEFADLSVNDAPIATYDVSEVPGEVYVPSGRAKVVYRSGEDGSAPDLLLSFAADLVDVRRRYCSGTESLDTPGVLTDGSGSEPYSYDTDCKWSITAPAGKKVHFRFSKLDTEMRRDMIYFFDGKGTHAPVMAIFSGQELPPELTTWNRQVLVWFVADGQNQGDGWEAEVSFVDD
jgi:hypothetical protein